MTSDTLKGCRRCYNIGDKPYQSGVACSPDPSRPGHGADNLAGRRAGGAGHQAATWPGLRPRPRAGVSRPPTVGSPGLWPWVPGLRGSTSRSPDPTLPVAKFRGRGLKCLTATASRLAHPSLRITEDVITILGGFPMFLRYFEVNNYGLPTL